IGVESSRWGNGPRWAREAGLPDSRVAFDRSRRARGGGIRSVTKITGGKFMKTVQKLNSFVGRNIGEIIAIVSLVIAVVSVGMAHTSAKAASAATDLGNPMVLGMAFDGHQVSNLDNTIKYYETIDFHVKSKADWHVDKTLNKLGNTPGAET